MRTSRDFSTIFHGSKEFLKMRLDLLVEKKKILFYAFVFHHKEDDEKKDHIHVYMVPDGRVDTDTIRTELEEYDLINLKPIRPLPFQSSKFGDWYLYSTHNVSYLAAKGQTRKYHYSISDFITSSEDYLLELVHTIDMSKINRMDVVIRAVETGQPFHTLVSSGQIPIQLLTQYREAYRIISQSSYNELTNRGTFNGHDDGESDVVVEVVDDER